MNHPAISPDQCGRLIRRRGLSMPNDWFAAFLHALPIMLGGLVLGCAIVGFWRGLSVRPHEPENRPAKPPVLVVHRAVKIQLDGADVSGAGAISAKRVIRITGRMPTATMSKAASAPSSKLPRVAN